MELTSYLVLVAFLILLAFLVIQYFGLKNAETEIFGKPSIIPIHFYTGKIALITPWVYFCVKALFPSLAYIKPPSVLIWIAIVLLYAGVSMMIASIIELGLSVKIGIPRQKIVLKTMGIYKFSRNPLYSGAILIAIASCLYFPDMINIILTIYIIITHHIIILSEEKYLKETFGQKYDDYAKKVRRYL